MSSQDNAAAPGHTAGTTAAAAPAATLPVGTDAADRSTGFEATTGGPEMKSGEVLLVQAYVAIWLLLFGYLALLWRRQRSLHLRLDAMDRVLDRATAAAQAGKAPPS